MRKLAITAALCLIATTAQAQDISPAFDMTLMSNWSGQGAALEQMKRDAGSHIARRQAPARAAANPGQVLARLAYQPDPAVRRQVYLRAVSTVQKASPPDAAQLRTQLANGQLRGGVAAYLRGYGMSANNVVDTTALYLAAAWFAARANPGDPSPAQMRGLRAQVAQAFASMPRMLNASNAAKQELAEATIIQASLASTMANQASKDPKIAGAVRNAMRRAVQGMYQLDITAMQLTAQGLR